MKKLICLLVLLVPGIASAQYRGGGPNGPPPQYSGDPYAFHNGLTFEGNIGLGGMWSRDTTGNTSDTQPSLGLDLGIGGFLTPQVALSLRMASVNYSQDINDAFGPIGTDTISAIFVGPSLQYWATPQFFLGGGIGYAIAHESVTFDDGSTIDSTNDPTGIALDLRAGFEIWRQFRNSLNISVEYTPGFFKQDRGNGVSDSIQLNGFQVAFGYQFL
jgi:opacity protein-like surface antigen